jgi:tungstate transport system ATP-binding protein
MNSLEALAGAQAEAREARIARAPIADGHRPLLQLKSVAVRFGAVPALSNVDLVLARGERVALIGANGSGKSTLLRVLHRLVRPGAGTMWSDGGARQAMVFQRPHMLYASAAANVALGLWIAGRPWPRARADALVALRRVRWP